MILAFGGKWRSDPITDLIIIIIIIIIIDQIMIFGHCLFMTLANTDQYIRAFRGRFTSLLKWHELDAFWVTLKQQPHDDWYVYKLNEEAPTEVMMADSFITFIDELNAALRKNHKEDYCGIVYADSNTAPEFIKIFDPKNLGVSCGFSDNPPLPGWTITKISPAGITTNMLAIKPKRWWQKIFG